MHLIEPITFADICDAIFLQRALLVGSCTISTQTLPYCAFPNEDGESRLKMKNCVFVRTAI